MRLFYYLTGVLLLIFAELFSQDYVNITFRHYPTNAKVVRAFIPGEFNGWGPNSSGVIAPNAPSLMDYVDSLKFYTKTLRLKIGSRYNYKIHEHYNQSGSDGKWFTDPLNPLINTNDNNNSMVDPKKVMIFQIWPPQDAIIPDVRPTLTAGIFIAENDSLDLTHSTIYLDKIPVSTFEGKIVAPFAILRYQLPTLQNGQHKIVIHAIAKSGVTVIDSTQFFIIAGEIFFLTPSIDSVWAETKFIRWQINKDKSQIQQIVLKHLEGSSVEIPVRSESQYNYEVNLNSGLNRYVVTMTDISGQSFQTDTLRLIYQPDNRPQPRIRFKKSGNQLLITGQANDPLKQSVTYFWQNQNTNPLPIPGVDGQTESSFSVALPELPGDYSLKLTVKSASGFQNAAVNFFTITVDSQFINPDLKIVPSWVANAQIYCLFFRSFTAQGTITAATNQLEQIKNMGFNVLWVLPVMDVDGIIDQGTNIGYNIIDFYKIEPFYGSSDDFKRFVQKAHELGLRVILDVTPNHSGRAHSIALDVRSKQKYSRFYDFYQHEMIPHNTNGLNQSISNEGIVYYSGFSDALLNWNWIDEEARTYMLEVYKHWLLEYDIDGYRFDVYWGPHRRYGLCYFDQPLRRALKAAKSDILLLAETDGTGAGTEVIYADQDGGVDLGYDWKLKGAITSYPSISNLDLQLYNAGYRPGLNSFFLRFLENQDEDRVAYRFQSIEKTIPVSTALFMSTGIPQIYQGQEVGMGYNMSGGRDARVRSTVNWQNPSGKILAPHYQKLAQIRAQFPAFRRQMEDVNGDGQITSQDPSRQIRLTSNSNLIYAFGRPFRDQNGIVIMNFCDKTQTVEVTTGLENWAEFSAGFKTDATYFLNDLYAQTSQEVSGSNLKILNLTLAPYSVAIYTVSLTADKVNLPDLLVNVENPNNIEVTTDFKLFTNYPNPFNPATHIRYQLVRPVRVKIAIFNLLGQKLMTLVDENQSPGIYQVIWDGLDQSGKPAGSGIYFCQMEADEFSGMQKMLLVR